MSASVSFSIWFCVWLQTRYLIYVLYWCGGDGLFVHGQIFNEICSSPHATVFLFRFFCPCWSSFALSCCLSPPDRIAEGVRYELELDTPPTPRHYHPLSWDVLPLFILPFKGQRGEWRGDWQTEKKRRREKSQVHWVKLLIQQKRLMHFLIFSLTCYKVVAYYCFKPYRRWRVFGFQLILSLRLCRGSKL